MNYLLIFVAIFTIQLVFFLYAAWKKTDKVTDLSYGGTFVLVSAVLLILNDGRDYFQLFLTVVIGIWGLRLAGFLFYRVLKTGRDNRFDGIRENFWKFASFWLLQAVSIFIVMLPSLIVLQMDDIDRQNFSLVFLFVSIAGILIESVADIQKLQFRFDPNNKGRWTDVGLWKYSRYPNYLGEMMMWWGVLGFSIFYLSGIEFLAVISPVYISYLLLFVTGVPTVEKRYDEKFADNPGYLEYKRKTGKILPKFF